MNLAMPPILSRLLALAILGLLVFAGWAGLVQPVAERYLTLRETVELTEEQLPRLRALAAQTPALEEELARLKRDPTARTRQLSGGGDSLAAADLQNRLGRIASANGIVLRSTQILPAEDEEGFRRVSIRVALEGDTPAMLKILHGLESSPTMLFVDNLEIRARSGGRIRRNPSSTAAAEDILLIRFDLSGYVAGGQK